MRPTERCHGDTTARRRFAAGRRSPGNDLWWSRPGWLLLLAGTAVAYTWALDINGYGNAYYAAAAYGGAQSWTAWLFGSFDAASFISVDKPPLSLWVTGLSVRLFGLGSWSILLPQALAGVAAVAILHHTVRRWQGPAAGLLAGAMLAVTPVAVVMFRYNNPDAILTLLLVAALAVAWSATRRGSAWRLAAAGALVGLAFLTKTTQALLVVPAIAVTYLVAAPATLWRRLLHGLAAGAAAVAAAGWWILLAETSPAAPYFGQTTSGSFLDYILGVNGLDRLSGAGPPGPDPFGGSGGWGRLFNEQVAGQVSWLIPLAAAGLLVVVWRRRGWQDRGVRAGWILWGTTLTTHFAVYSLMAGVFHPYYTLSMAPAVAAIAGAGTVEMWRAYRERHASWWVLPTGILATGGWAAVVLARTPGFLPWLGPAVVGGAAVTALVLAFGRTASDLPRGLGPAVVTLALAVTLAGPVAYAAASIGVDHAGGDPKAGPAVTAGTIPPNGPDGRRPPDGRPGPPPPPRLPAAGPNDGPVPRRPAVPAGAGPGPPRGAPGPDRPIPAELVTYLSARYDGETWLVATVGTHLAAQLILATGEPVMAMGGFSGDDPTPTDEELTAFVATGALRFVLAQPGQDLHRWTGVVRRLCRPVDPADLGGVPFVLYDCAA